MRALVFRPSPARRRLARGLGGLTRAVHWGRLSGLRLEEVGEPPLPGPGWVRLRVLKAGIGREEIRMLTGEASPLLEPFGSWPAVPGREILGEVVEAGAEVRAVEVGRRVVVDPHLSCAARGFGADPCPACASGRAGACARAGEEGALELAGRPLGRGARLGLHAELPGGWAERIVAHRSQLVPVADALPDQAAVLVEPLAGALHAAMAAGVGGPETAPEGPGGALVVGGGVRALGTVRALRLLGFTGPVTARVEREAEVARALRLGATRAVDSDEELREVMAGTGAHAYMPLEGEEVWRGGGFSPVFEWTGRGGAVGRALRMTAAGGRLALAYGPRLPEGELALAAQGEVGVVGVAGYGPRGLPGPEVSTLRLAHDLLAADPGMLRALVTHVYPLDQYREALDASVGRGREDPMKVLLDPAI